MSARPSLPGSLLLAALSAALYQFAYPPWNIRPVAFICLVPLLLALRSGSLGRALFLAWFWATLAALGITGELPASIARYYDRGAWFAVVAGNLVFSLTAALYYMGFAALYRSIVRRSSLASPFLVAAAWVSVELARARLFTGSSLLVGNPVGLLGYTHSSGSLAQLASATGVYGISFMVVLVNAGVASWIAGRLLQGHPKGQTTGALCLAVASAVAATIAGAWILRTAPPLDTREGDFRQVAVAQGNIALGRRWRSDFHAKNLDVYLDLTRRAIESGKPQTVIWPEAAMNFFIESEPTLRAAIGSVLRPNDVELLAGGPSSNGTREPPHFNSVFAIDSDGAVRGRYDKEILVPFFEFFPIAGLDFVRRNFGGAGRFTPGPKNAPPLETRLGRAGVLVCFEAMLGEVAAERVSAGAEILISPSNDSWIADAGIAEHMLIMSALRAIEQNRYMVRASTSGPSAVIDPWGRVVVRTTAYTRHVLVGRVEPRQELSLYWRLGDTFAYLCAVLVGGNVLWGWQRRRRHEPPQARIG